ncbi:hypothetical protein ACA910_002425 [Epithemia clementina (nom. ined.)]
MRVHRRSANLFFSELILVIWLCCLADVTVSASSLQRSIIASASIQHKRQQRIGHLPYSSFTSPSCGRRRRVGGSRRTDSAIILAAKRGRRSSENSFKSSEAAPTDSISGPSDAPPTSYKDLSLTGKFIAGVVEVSVVALLDYVIGFFGGYVVGTVCGLPGLAFGKGGDISSNLMQTASRRLSEMHQRSFRWATGWGGVNAVVGGFGTSARILRGGVDDEWTSVLSSMALGAFFCRKNGYLAMVRGALFYGALVKLFSSLSQPALEFQDEVAVDL